MLHGPHQIHAQGFAWAFDYTHAAPVTLLRIDDCLVLLGRRLLLHIDATKLASVNADLTTGTQVLINNGLIAALVRKVIAVVRYGPKLYAAIRTAEAEVASLRSPASCGNEACLLTDIQNFTSFLDADSLSYASINDVLHRPGG